MLSICGCESHREVRRVNFILLVNNNDYSLTRTQVLVMKNSRFWDVLLKVLVAAATAALTAVTTTSCMGHGPLF